MISVQKNSVRHSRLRQLLRVFFLPRLREEVLVRDLVGFLAAMARQFSDMADRMHCLKLESGTAIHCLDNTTEFTNGLAWTAYGKRPTVATLY